MCVEQNVYLRNLSFRALCVYRAWGGRGPINLSYLYFICFLLLLPYCLLTGQLCRKHSQEQQHHQRGARRLRHRLVQPQQSSVRVWLAGQGDCTSQHSPERYSKLVSGQWRWSFTLCNATYLTLTWFCRQTWCGRVRGWRVEEGRLQQSSQTESSVPEREW